MADIPSGFRRVTGELIQEDDKILTGDGVFVNAQNISKPHAEPVSVGVERHELLRRLDNGEVGR